MSDSKKIAISGRTLGAILVGAAAASVFFIDWKPEVPELPPTIRPLKTLVVGEAAAGVKWQYPAKVSAREEADVAFEVSGTITEFLVNEGTKVTKGQLLASLDSRDYENEAKSAKAEMERAKAQLDRVEEAAKSNAVSKQEVSDARAAFDKASAEHEIKLKAVEDTHIKAKFDGVISRTYVQVFENIQAKQPILNLQDISSVKVEASIPESRVALGNRDGRREQVLKKQFTASFDYYPGRTFPLTVHEFTTEADSVTQTYKATFIMEAPADANILPGMSAMVSEASTQAPEVASGEAWSLPLDVVPVDGLGQYFVWVLEASDGDVYAATRRDVSVGEMSGDSIAITDGLSRGDRVAAAGVHVINEGQKVRLLDSDS